MLRYKYYFILIMIIFMFSCDTGRNFRIDTPARFAEYIKVKKYYKAISSDNVRLRVYTIKNDESNELELWKDAVDYYLKGGGYHKNSEKSIPASGLNASYSEYIIRYNGENYVYAVALFVKGKSVYVVETGGPESYYNKRRDAIIKAISTFRVVE